MVQKKEDETLRSAEKTTYFHKYFQLLVMNPMMGPWGAEKELDWPGWHTVAQCKFVL